MVPTTLHLISYQSVGRWSGTPGLFTRALSRSLNRNHSAAQGNYYPFNLISCLSRTALHLSHQYLNSNTLLFHFLHLFKPYQYSLIHSTRQLSNPVLLRPSLFLAPSIRDTPTRLLTCHQENHFLSLSTSHTPHPWTIISFVFNVNVEATNFHESCLLVCIHHYFKNFSLNELVNNFTESK